MGIIPILRQYHIIKSDNITIVNRFYRNGISLPAGLNPAGAVCILVKNLTKTKVMIY